MNPVNLTKPRSEKAGARTIGDPTGKAKLCKGSEGGRWMRAKRTLLLLS